MPLSIVKTSGQDRPDAEIARRIAQGDRQALTTLMRRHNQRLFRVARSVLRNDADAEEAVQEAFFSAYRAMGRFRADSALSTWLVRIVINESNKRLHKSKRLHAVLEFGDDLEVRGDSQQAQTNEFIPSQPEQAMVRVETRRLIEAKIDLLPDVFRTVFVLRAVEEMTVEEAAQCLDILPATVRTRYFRARALLRKSLAKDIGHGIEDAFAFAGERCDRIVAGVLARVDAL
ncbi:MAG: RNA polymerase sigma factor [Candidimonas sp.]|nr:MAG: RNA polymerase sigma factor [Candidimonas sp.]TAM22882.1 MAG: RNA polymerase sigma factor [Candidimonas sp.]TAM76151.1 MAG: RNA polymerase sigma factor [Candidimonas sp.]